MDKYTIENMVKGKCSRGLRPVGEVFSIQLARGGFMFGRVVINDVSDASWLIHDARPAPPWPPSPGSYLVYFYRHVSLSSVPPALACAKDVAWYNVLNRTSWTHGYFQPSRIDPVGSYEELPQHLLLHRGVNPEYYCDPRGNPLVPKQSRFAIPSMHLSGYAWVDHDVGEFVKSLD